MPWDKIVEGVFTIFGGNKSAKAAEEMVRLQKEAEKKQYQYDLDSYNAAKESAISKRDYAIKEIELRVKNEGKIAEHKDAMNLASYNYNMQIRNQQQDLNDRMYAKSEDVYDKQLTINAANEKAAKMNERRKLREIETEKIGRASCRERV